MKFQTLLAVWLLTLSAQAGASTTYEYVGANYSVFGDSPLISGNYTASMKVTGTLEFAAPLAPNLDSVDLESQIVSFSFFDGRNAFSSASADLSKDNTLFYFRTDAAGNLIEWLVTLFNGDVSLSVGDRAGLQVGVFGDLGIIELCGCTFPEFVYEYAESTTVGVWSVRTATVPLPTTAVLFASAIAGLGCLRRRAA